MEIDTSSEPTRESLVPLHSDAYYRDIAAEAVKQASIDEPPVPLESLAERVGIPIRFVSLPGFFGGAIVAEDGMPVALLNLECQEDERRRTLAHLLGHLLLVLADPETGYPRGTSSDHREADIAANELLLPEHLVRDQALKWFNDHRYLARLFGVTESEMTARMHDLGLIKVRGVLWDY